MSELAAALDSIKLKILKYDPEKRAALVISRRGSMGIDKFCALVQKELGKGLIKFPAVFTAVHDEAEMEKLVEEYVAQHTAPEPEAEFEIPDQLKGLTLNMDMSASETKLFLTDENDLISEISGNSYIKICKLKELDAVEMARKVIPQYLPRDESGVSIKKFAGKEKEVFNTYIPPIWTRYAEGKLPDQLPELFDKLVKHVFPIREEREYFFSWLYHSLYDRAFVYMILCGAPGTGKNRLKLVMRALHGHTNTIDGKRSTLRERFNAQLADSTLLWFDELSYDHEMENNMKELQNDSISIERKGVDATRSTRIYASTVISNNKPRDNFISFDSRKFAPLSINHSRLETSMKPSEIDKLSKKVEDQESETFDPVFLAQIAKWVEKHGKSDKWPHLEYRGPMFYKLAHTSMTRWQKKAVTMILGANPKIQTRLKTDPEKGFLWSSLEEISIKKHGDKSLQFPDYTSVKYFFDIFVDAKGRKAFETTMISGDIMGDFWVKSLFKVKIMTEAQVMNPVTKGNENGKTSSSKYDI